MTVPSALPGARRGVDGCLVRHRETVMGTVVCFDVAVADGTPARQLQAGLGHARARLHHADALFSLWKLQSPMSRVRRRELPISAAPREVGEILAICERAREVTRGWFDASAMPGGLDPTGLVKGWAAQRALEALLDAGLPDAMVNAAGDIAAAGSGDGSGSWRVGIQHPGSRAHLLGVVGVAAAIATSGSYERGEHLFDPFRRTHRSGFASASVVGPDLVLADAMATGLAVAGPDGLDFVEAAAGYEAIGMLADGTTRRTSGWHFLPAGAGGGAG